jgi:hypothetical protein
MLNAIAATIGRAAPRTIDRTFAAQAAFVLCAEAQPVGGVKQVSRIAYLLEFESRNTAEKTSK